MLLNAVIPYSKSLPQVLVKPEQRSSTFLEQAYQSGQAMTLGALLDRHIRLMFRLAPNFNMSLQAEAALNLDRL